MAAHTSAGTVLYLSAGVPTTYDASGFSALTWTALGELTDAGEVGKEYALVTHNPLATRRTEKFKGSYNNGSMALQLARDSSDAGQVLAKTAAGSDAPYSVKIVYQNSDIEYSQAMVMSYKTSIGSIDQMTGASITLEITGDIIEDLA